MEEERYHAFLAALEPDPDRRGGAYEGLRRRLETFFIERTELRQDAEDLATEAILLAAGRFTGTTREHAQNLAFTLARELLSASRHAHDRLRPLEDAPEPSVEPSAEQAMFQDEIHLALMGSLKRLDKQDRELLIAFYEAPRPPIRELASRLGRAERSIYGRVVYLRKRLFEDMSRRLGGRNLSAGPDWTFVDFSRAVRHVGARGDAGDLVEYYAAHRAEINMLADHAAMFAVALLDRLGPMSREDLSRHVSWPASEAAEICDSLAGSGFIGTDRDTGLMRVLQPGRKLLSLLLS
jgi:DNA-directed RNA polymerase specialized sigma24 family protein